MEQTTQNKNNKRKILLMREEVEILKWLFIKSIIPITTVILVSSILIFIAVQLMINKIVMNNFGIVPTFSLSNVSQSFGTYLYMAAANIILMFYMSFALIYVLVRNLVLPVFRITREIKQSLETNSDIAVSVRKNDTFLIPLAEMINKLSAKARREQ